MSFDIDGECHEGSCGKDLAEHGNKCVRSGVLGKIEVVFPGAVLLMGVKGREGRE
jgi:hypothetical protein